MRAMVKWINKGNPSAETKEAATAKLINAFRDAIATDCMFPIEGHAPSVVRDNLHVRRVRVELAHHKLRAARTALKTAWCRT